MSIPIARSIAKISGDGNLSRKYIRYANHCEELIEEFRQDIIEIFGDINFNEGIGNSGTPFIQINGLRPYYFFVAYLDSYKSENIKIPKQVLLASKKIKKEYLRTFYDDEGGPNLRIFNKTKEWKRDIKIASTSKIIIEQIKNLLIDDFRINSGKIISHVKKGYRPCFYLFITGKSNFKRFRNRIGFKQPSKIKKLDLLIETYSNTFRRNNGGFERLKAKLIKQKHL